MSNQFDLKPQDAPVDRVDRGGHTLLWLIIVAVLSLAALIVLAPGLVIAIVHPINAFLDTLHQGLCPTC